MTTRSLSRRLRALATAAVAAGACAIAVAACGGSSGSGASSAGASHHQSFLNFSKCMRSHGVPDFPDPQAGGGIEITPADGITPGSPAMRSAQGSCGHLLPGGGPGNVKPSAHAEQQLLAVAKCMRGHGFQNFPDPTTSPPAQPAGGAPGVVLGMGGVFLNLGAAGVDPSSPAFQRAASACNFPGAQTPGAATNGGG
jgi:hypothetical protein